MTKQKLNRDMNANANKSASGTLAMDVDVKLVELQALN